MLYLFGGYHTDTINNTLYLKNSQEFIMVWDGYKVNKKHSIDYQMAHREKEINVPNKSRTPMVYVFNSGGSVVVSLKSTTLNNRR